MAAFRKSVPVRVQVCSSSGTKETTVKTTQSSTVGFILRSVAFWLPQQGKGYGLILPDSQQLQDMGTKLGVYKLQPYDVIQVKRFVPGIISVHVGSTEQSFQVSMDNSVREITEQLCRETGISDAKNYRLALLEGGRGASEGDTEDMQSKWLNPDMSLDQLGVNSKSRLQLRKLPQWGPGGITEFTQDQGTSVDVSADCESLQAQKRLPAVLSSSMPRRGSTASPTALQTILEDSESRTESQQEVPSPDLDNLSFEELEAYLADVYKENVQVGEKQSEEGSAIENSQQRSNQSQRWGTVDREAQMGSKEVEASAEEFKMNAVRVQNGEIKTNGGGGGGGEAKTKDIKVQENDHVDSHLDSGECGSSSVAPQVCVTDETGLFIAQPQATSTPLKAERRYKSQEGERKVAERVSEGSRQEKPEEGAVFTSHKAEQKDADPIAKALPGAALSPQEALQSLWPVSPPDLEEGYPQHTRQPPSSFTAQLENQLNAVAAMKPRPPKAVVEVKKHHNTYSSGMQRGSEMEEAVGQPVEVELIACTGTTRSRYFIPLKDTWPRRKTAGTEMPYNDSGIGCSPAVIHSSRKSTPGMVKSSCSLDLGDGDASSRLLLHPTSYRDSVLTSTGDGGAPVYPEDQGKAHTLISDSHYGKQSEVMLSQGDDEVFAGPSHIQPRRDFSFNFADINTPPWSRLGASTCSQPGYSSENLLNERDTLSWEHFLETSDDVPIFGSSTRPSKQKRLSGPLPHRKVSTGRSLQKSSSSPDVVVGEEDDHRSITSADSLNWRLEYYKMNFPELVSKYTVVYVIVMDQDLRPFLVNPKKNVQDIIREICCTFKMGNPRQWHFCMPKGLQVVLSKTMSTSRMSQTKLSVGSMGSGMTKKTFFHLSTDLVSTEDILDGGRPLIDQFPFTAKPYVLHMRKYESSKFSGSMDGLLEETDIGCEWPDGEVEAKSRCFHQIWCSVAQSHCPVEKHISAEIAALLLQAHFGNFSKSNRRMAEVLPHFLPEMHRTKRDVLKQTKKIYKRLKGITAEHAMQSVITRFREQPCHDGIFFHVKAVHEKKSRFKANKLKAGIFGMCFREIIYLDSVTAKVVFRRNYSEIKSVEASKRHFKIDFGAHVSDPFAASSPVALEVMNILKLFIQMHPIPEELHPPYRAYSVSQASLPLQNNPQVEVIQI